PGTPPQPGNPRARDGSERNRPRGQRVWIWVRLRLWLWPLPLPWGAKGKRGGVLFSFAAGNDPTKREEEHRFELAAGGDESGGGNDPTKREEEHRFELAAGDESGGGNAPTKREEEL